MIIFFLVCLALIALISCRCWFLSRSGAPPLEDQNRKYEDFEDVAIRLIEIGSKSQRENRERIREFYRDFPHPDPVERMKRTLR
jgi:hypothetical protein